MPKLGPTIKSLLTNKDKLFKLARTPLNEHCSAILLKKLPEKLGDPEKFLIPCDFPGMDECLALADLGVSINLMPLSVWNNLSLPELTPTLITIKLADRSISRPIDVAEDVFVKVGKRSFLKTRRSLINVYAEELTLRVNNEAVTFNLDQTSRYSANYNDMTANRIDVIDMACEEYSQDVLGFSDVIASGNPTPYYDPIVSTSSSTLTPFEDSDFLLEEVDAFFALKDDPTSPKVNHSYYDTEGDILLLEAFLNDDPSLPPPNQGMVNKKIYDVIKKEVLKLLDAGFIYPIPDIPWEKSHFMVKEGIILGHNNSKNGIEVYKAKVDVIAKLPHPNTVKGIRSFLGHAGFYQRLIQDFSKIARLMTRLLEKDTPFFFSNECIEAF
uniref:Reverse transcriptase domain-containing protein n=1 Tax=Tanacetum cinerariifolium TaxID=118510 RepID=A0A699KKX3_TANCI|nr:reverse transcriptase domain-containing protein [Tanacetum cinerariifolium]